MSVRRSVHGCADRDELCKDMNASAGLGDIDSQITLSEQLDALLPQTQCGRCGYAGCKPYARAMASGTASANRCPPGGRATLDLLSAVLHCEPMALDPECGEEGPWRMAQIDEAQCIGCTVCINACPVDAIMGAAKRMHTVIESECVGCELCVLPCPVDCISLVAMPTAIVDRWMVQHAANAKRRYEFRDQRLAQLTLQRKEARAQRKRPAAPVAVARAAGRAEKQRFIRAAVERARLRRRGLAAVSETVPGQEA